MKFLKYFSYDVYVLEIIFFIFIYDTIFYFLYDFNKNFHHMILLAYYLNYFFFSLFIFMILLAYYLNYLLFSLFIFMILLAYYLNYLLFFLFIFMKVPIVISFIFSFVWTGSTKVGSREHRLRVFYYACVMEEVN